MDSIQDALNAVARLEELARSIENVELHAALVELKSTLVDIKLELSGLGERIADLERVGEIEPRLHYEHEAYWLEEEDGPVGPLCGRCWDVDRKLVRQRNARIAREGKYRWICPACERGAWIPIDEDRSGS